MISICKSVLIHVQVYGLQKGSVFSEDSLPYFWQWNVHATSQINKTGIGDVPSKVLLRTALSVHFLEIELLEQHFTMGLQKGDFLFLIIYKDQQAANTFFWPFLNFLKDLHKLLSSMTCASIMRSKDHKRAVNQTTKRLLTKWCFILTSSP